ncbi:MAG TPA: BON domain-containing protein [Abditibacteriaceae bacterium]|jgi:hyperosmotically inducible protein
MKKAHLSRMLASACTALLLSLAGCQDKNNNGMPDSPATGAQVEKTVENAGESLEKTVENAVPQVEKAAGKGVSLAADAAITGKVKSALIADKNISASEIDVTTKNKVVYLNGTVPNNTHRALASKIAAKAAGAGHPVKNSLKVAGKAPAKTR